MKNETYINFCRDDTQASFASMTIGIDKQQRKLLFAIEDERVLRRKYRLYDGNVRKYIFDRIKEFNLETDNIEILDTHGITNSEICEIQLKGANGGHYVAKKCGDHHLNHALNAYYQSGFKDASILVIDGCDYPINGKSIAIFTAENDKVELVKSYGTNKSLGVLYGYGCIECGFTWDAGGKLMGLATYGKTFNDHYVPFFTVDEHTGEINESHGDFHQREYIDECPSAIIDFDEKLINSIKYHLKNYIDFSFTPNKSYFNFSKANFAALIQKMFEDAEFSLLKYMHNILPSKNLIITGGCALNCVANGKILRSNMWDNVFIPNTCNDAGNAIGAAIHRYNIQINKPLIYNNYIYDVPKEYNKIISAEDLANRIRNGQIVAWFEGGSEYGPRALCHRSILANPELKNIAYRINEIKHRHYWRPLAPVVLDTHFKEIFDVDKTSKLHELMLSTERIRPDWKERIPAVCACDGTSRPQVLHDNRYNSVLYNLMKDYNLPILVNTSMNDANEPICETPEDAIKFSKKNDDILLVFIKNNKIYTK